MAIRNSHYFKLQSNNFNYSAQLPIQINKNPTYIDQTDVLDQEDKDNQPKQQQQIKLRAISMNVQEQQTNFKPTQNIFSYYQNLKYKQDGDNNSKKQTDFNKQIIKKIPQIQQECLSDQIDIVLKQQKLQYKQLQKQNQEYQDILRKQYLDLSFDEFEIPVLNTKYDQQQRSTSNNNKSTKNNCTQSYFVSTYYPICYYCKSEIQMKPIKFICFHQYHQECLSDMILYQIEQKFKRNTPYCLCGLNIKQQSLLQLPQGQQLIRILMQKQLQLIFDKYQENLNKCPTCDFRFIQDYRLSKQCYCPNCKRTFKIQ